MTESGIGLHSAPARAASGMTPEAPRPQGESERAPDSTAPGAGVGFASWPQPLPRRRVGRAAVLEFVRAEVGAGRGVPDARTVARRFGWLVGSGRDALVGLAAAGYLRITRREPPRGKHVYELTEAGAHARSKVCATCNTRRPLASFWPLAESPDGRGSSCKQCAEAARRRGRKA
jgi:hypothetical protein